MNKYIKIRGHNNWFLFLEKGKPVDLKLTETMRERLFRKAAGGVHGDITNPTNWSTRVMMAASREIDYEQILTLGELDMLLRPFGSYMFLTKDVEILETRYADDFPIEKFATIVICENDADASSTWYEYLKKRFKGESIETINFFDTRSDEEVKEYFKHAKYVTFTTTFTTMAWWKLLVRNLQSNNKVIGNCADKEGWKKALSIYKNIEKVTI